MVAVNEETGQRLEALAQRGGLVSARIAGLVESDDYKQGRELHKLREAVQSAQADAKAKRDAAEAKLKVAAADAGRDAGRAAEPAQLNGVWSEMKSVLPSGSSGVRSRHDQIREVREAVSLRETALDRRRGAEDSVEQARTDLTAAVEER